MILHAKYCIYYFLWPNSLQLIEKRSTPVKRDHTSHNSVPFQRFLTIFFHGSEKSLNHTQNLLAHNTICHPLQWIQIPHLQQPMEQNANPIWLALLLLELIKEFFEILLFHLFNPQPLHINVHCSSYWQAASMIPLPSIFRPTYVEWLKHKTEDNLVLKNDEFLETSTASYLIFL